MAVTTGSVEPACLSTIPSRNPKDEVLSNRQAEISAWSSRPPARKAGVLSNVSMSLFRSYDELESTRELSTLDYYLFASYCTILPMFKTSKAMFSHGRPTSLTKIANSNLDVHRIIFFH